MKELIVAASVYAVTTDGVAMLRWKKSEVK